MKSAKVLMTVAMLCSLAAAHTMAQTKSTEEVTALLHEFMQAAGRGDRAIFDKFFADDVIYTRATGAVITKADIMESLGKPTPASEGKAAYSAEDIYRPRVWRHSDCRLQTRGQHNACRRKSGNISVQKYRNVSTAKRPVASSGVASDKNQPGRKNELMRDCFENCAEPG